METTLKYSNSTPSDYGNFLLRPSLSTALSSETIVTSHNGKVENTPLKWRSIFSYAILGAVTGFFILGLILKVIPPTSPKTHSDPIVAAMKAEQQWLISQHLTQERYIGDVDNPLSDGAYMAAIDEANNPASDFFSEHIDAILGKKPSVNSFSKYIIFPGKHDDKLVPRWSFYSNPERVYRHEDGHANMYEDHVVIQAPQDWNPFWSRIITHRLNVIQNELYPDRLHQDDSLSLTDWRERWLSAFHAEAFADAFSCLSIARRGQGPMTRCALTLESLRIFPTADFENGWQSLSLSGNDHAVEMASYMSAQLSATEVAALDKKGLEELCERIAEESMAWELARAVGSGGVLFFNQDGVLWWKKISAQQGISAHEAELSFNAWKQSVYEAYPKAAFGQADWLIQGHSFHVKKLPQTLQKRRWRFEGFSHRILAITPGMFDDNNTHPSSLSMPNRLAQDHSASCKQTPESCKDDRQNLNQDDLYQARLAAVEMHFSLVNLLREDPHQEALRLKELVGGERYLSKVIDQMERQTSSLHDGEVK